MENGNSPLTEKEYLDSKRLTMEYSSKFTYLYLMDSTKSILLKLKSLKPILEKEFGVNKIGYFGSLATGRFSKKSDIDLIVRYTNNLGWKFFDLKDFLENHLGREVDIVTERSIKDGFKESIMREVKFL